MPTLVICRHGERLDYVQDGWTAGAARPWDPPLTRKGHGQAALAGAAIAGHLEALGLPPVRMTPIPAPPAPPDRSCCGQVSRIFTSALLRCAETAVGIGGCPEVGVGRVAVEPDLVETICENWYYSWAIPGERRWRSSAWAAALLVLRPLLLCPCCAAS